MPNQIEDGFSAQQAIALGIGGLLLILFGTLFPFNFSWDVAAHPFDNKLDWRDVIANLILFIPFGFGLSYFLWQKLPRLLPGLAIVVLISAALSAGVEVLQTWLPSRHPNPFDIINNSISGGLGALLYLRIYCQGDTVLRDLLRLPHQRIAKVLATGLVGYLVLVVLLMQFLSSGMELTNWKLNLPLLVGNEITNDRPWQGYIAQVTIADRAMSPSEVEQLLAGQPAGQILGESLQADYQFAGSGNYADRSGQLPSLEWQGTPPAPEPQAVLLNANPMANQWLATPPVPQLMQKLQRSSQFTLRTTIATAATEQAGPARIISFSSGPLSRNLTLGQDGDDLVVRLRTPFTGINGISPELAIDHALGDRRFHQIIITYATSVLRVYRDEVNNVESFVLTPDVLLVGYLSNLSRLYPAMVPVLRTIYHLVVFIPLGILLVLIQSLLKIRSKILLFGGIIIFPAIILEFYLASLSDRSMASANILLSVLAAVIPSIIALGQRRSKDQAI